MAFTQDVSQTTVRSVPLTNGKPVARPLSAGDWAIGIALIVFGGIGWLTGARYTLFGWVAGLNLFLAWLGLPVAVPVPAGWWILAMIPIGIVYSRVEMQIWHAKTPQFVIGWGLIVATDVGSTYLGVRTVAADAWPITQTIAASAVLAFIWAAILTFVSDWLILGGWQLLRK